MAKVKKNKLRSNQGDTLSSNLHKFTPHLLIVVVVFLLVIIFQFSYFMGQKNGFSHESDNSTSPTNPIELTLAPTITVEDLESVPSQAIKKNRMPVLIPITNKTVYCDEDKLTSIREYLASIQTSFNNSLSSTKSCLDSCTANYRSAMDKCMDIMSNDATYCINDMKPIYDRCKNGCQDAYKARNTPINNALKEFYTTYAPFCSNTL